MNNNPSSIRNHDNRGLHWHGPKSSLRQESQDVTELLQDLHAPCHVVRTVDGTYRFSAEGEIVEDLHSSLAPEWVCTIPASLPEQFGSREFRQSHNVACAYQAGAMAGGIASEELVIAMGKAGYLACFGSAGLSVDRVRQAIHRIQSELPQGPFVFNFIHTPMEPSYEREIIELYLKSGIRTVEASAFLDLTPWIVYYRAAGLSLNTDGHVHAANKVMAKISRREIALKFLSPPPLKILNELVALRLISAEQAQWAQRIPMADDIIVEADSGGHTDNRPLVNLLPSLMELRDEVQLRSGYRRSIRVGASGGIGTPESILAAFMMGADYVATGSINQSGLEANTSAAVKALLAQLEMTDVMMTPSSDMFEMGVKVQVVKRGTLYPLRAQKLYEIYRTYDGIDAIPVEERMKLEKQIFKKPLEEIWQDVVRYKETRAPGQIESARKNPKQKMSLIFRWYLGQSSQWAMRQTADRAMDYQIWCGPVMGAFNNWVKGTYLEDPANRSVADMAFHLMKGAAYLFRVRWAEMQGVCFAPETRCYKPQAPILPAAGILSRRTSAVTAIR